MACSVARSAPVFGYCDELEDAPGWLSAKAALEGSEICAALVPFTPQSAPTKGIHPHMLACELRHARAVLKACAACRSRDVNQCEPWCLRWRKVAAHLPGGVLQPAAGQGRDLEVHDLPVGRQRRLHGTQCKEQLSAGATLPLNLDNRIEREWVPHVMPGGCVPG